MIQANAKCINNGKKLNETIRALNNILNVVVSEEFEIVDSNNQPSKRWFFTGKLTGQKQSSDTGDKDRYGNTPSNNNRDQLSMNTGGLLGDSSGGVSPTGNVTGGGSGALRDDGSTTSGGGINSLNRGGVDQFGNSIGGSGALLDDGSTTAGGGINSLNRGGVDQFGNSIGGSGALLDDGSTTAGGGINSLNNAGLPGAPPLGGDTNTAARQQPTFADTSRMTPDGQPVTAADLRSGNWIPTRNGSLDLPELERLQNTGQLTQIQADLLNSMSGQDAGGSTSRSDARIAEKAARDAANAGRRGEVVDRLTALGPVVRAEANVSELERKLYDAKKDDKLRYDWGLNMWVYKKFGDPDSDLVVSIQGRLDAARAYLERLKAAEQ